MKKRYRAKITTAGYVVVGLTLAVALAGVNTGNNLLYLIASALLALMSVSGILSLANIALLKVSIHPPDEIFAKTPAPFRVTVKGPFYPCFFIHIECPYGTAFTQVVKGEAETTLWLSLPRRGSFTVDNLHLSSGFPLGFFYRSRLIEGPDVLVYPKPKEGKVPVKSQGKDIQEDFKDLKPYRGEPASRIAWQPYARGRQLMVKEFEHPATQKVIIDLGKGCNEDLIEAATWTALQYFRSGCLVGLILPDDTISPGAGYAHRRKILSALAHA